MKKKLLIIISAVLIIVSIIGYALTIGYFNDTGWQQSPYPFWAFSIIWGILYCSILWIKKIHPTVHPILWIVGLMPMFYGIYVGINMGV